jgi:hypothetical protein
LKSANTTEQKIKLAFVMGLSINRIRALLAQISLNDRLK